jgi:ribonuclease-3
VAETIGLGEALSVAPGEARAGVKRRATVLADALEAALGAIYLDGGLDPAREFVRRAWEGAMVAQEAPPKDAKTALQEWAQKRGLELPAYTVSARTGPPHAPVFVVTVSVGDLPSGEGTAGSKRAAEQLAAEHLYGNDPRARPHRRQDKGRARHDRSLFVILGPGPRIAARTHCVDFTQLPSVDRCSGQARA